MSMLKRYNAIRALEKRLRDEKRQLTENIFTHMLENGYDSVALDNNTKLEIVLNSANNIDFDKMKELYPEIYDKGIVKEWDYRKAILSIPEETLKQVFKDVVTRRKVNNLKLKQYIVDYRKGAREIQISSIKSMRVMQGEKENE